MDIKLIYSFLIWETESLILLGIENSLGISQCVLLMFSFLHFFFFLSYILCTVSAFIESFIIFFHLTSKASHPHLVSILFFLGHHILVSHFNSFSSFWPTSTLSVTFFWITLVYYLFLFIFVFLQTLMVLIYSIAFDCFIFIIPHPPA